MKQIISFLETAKLSRKQVHRNLTVFPLMAPNESEPDYLILDQALERDLIRITELDNGASVPELKLKNLSKKSVLIIEGEELVGAKQNRIVNSSFLIVGKTEVVIPVSCVEQGRWSYKSESFKTGKRMAHPSLRREYQQDVSYSMRQGEGYRSDQDRIWNNIAEKSVRMKVNAPTGAMADVFESYEDELSKFLEKFHLIEWQTGAVFAINGQVLGLECFGCHDTFKRFFDKLLKSYALDALDNLKHQKDESVSPEKARRFIKSVTQSKGEGHPSLGLGTNITFESRTVSGIALVEEDRILHLSAFKKEKTGNSRKTGFQRYSKRRSRRIY
jgi:hypothetical protein